MTHLFKLPSHPFSLVMVMALSLLSNSAPLHAAVVGPFIDMSTLQDQNCQNQNREVTDGFPHRFLTGRVAFPAPQVLISAAREGLTGYWCVRGCVFGGTLVGVGSN